MKKNNKTICVIGLGYIGLPTASMFATHGFRVHGVDTNTSIIKTLADGNIHIEEPGLATIVKAAITSSQLTVSEKPTASDVYIIAVPTPRNMNDMGIPTADMSFVQSALDSILGLLKKGDTVILESTSPPGTTRKMIIPSIEQKGFTVGKDIGVAYCPERVIPGKALKELIGNDRLVGAVTEKGGKDVRALYKSFVSGEVFITDPTVAEMVKIVENTYRDVNIGLANEIAQMCEQLDINVWDVIKLANRHPRVHLHQPGPGVGGHCISVDPWFLVELFPEKAKIIKTARGVNDDMPSYVVTLVEKALNGQEKAKISILGITYKGNVDDMRESPALTVIELFKKHHPKWTLAVYDPHVKSKNYPTLGIQETFDGSDVALVLAPHDEFKFLDPSEIGQLMKTRLIIDTHQIIKPERWVPAGFKVRALGANTHFNEQRVTNS